MCILCDSRPPCSIESRWRWTGIDIEKRGGFVAVATEEVLKATPLSPFRVLSLISDNISGRVVLMDYLVKELR